MVFVALGLLVGSRVLDKERPAQTLLGVRCHGDLSQLPGLTEGRAWR
jgi:hypothetical protein